MATNSNCGETCPITLLKANEMKDHELFRVCNDPSIYHIQALYKWIQLGNDIYPTTRMKITKSDVKRINNAYWRYFDRQIERLQKELNELKLLKGNIFDSKIEMFDNKPFGLWLKERLTYALQNIKNKDVVPSSFHNVDEDMDMDKMHIESLTVHGLVIYILKYNMTFMIRTRFGFKYGDHECQSILSLITTDKCKNEYEQEFILDQPEENSHISPQYINPNWLVEEADNFLFGDEDDEDEDEDERFRIDVYNDKKFSFSLPSRSGGNRTKEYKLYKKRRYVVRYGPKGGKYIIVGKDKIYI